METTAVQRLRTCRVCEGLTNKQLERVANACSWRQLQPDEMLSSPGDSISELYTVTRGRLKMFHGSEDQTERFIGYVNQGETVGQSAFLSAEFDNEIGIVADIASHVAVIDRSQAARLLVDIPGFRKNLIASFGARAASVFRGVNPRRFPKIVGVFASTLKSRKFLPMLCNELTQWNETICVFSDGPEPLANIPNVISLTAAAEQSKPADLRSRIRNQIANSNRVLIDISPSDAESAISTSALIDLINECDEILWCCDNETSNENHTAILANFVDERPELKSRIVCVQILAEGKTVGRRKPCGSNLANRDFLLPLVEDANSQERRLFQQGIDRIVRHLRGIKIGLALGGGGARGMSHLGVLKVLDSSGIGFDVMSGTSVGAMVGLGYAAGVSPTYLIDAFSSELRPSPWLDRLPGGRRIFLFGKFRARAWEKMLRKYYHDWTFEQLPIPFAVVVTDLVSGEQIVRQTGDIVQAILESINVPVLAKPILRNGKILVDGGILNNLPAELLTDGGAEYVIGVDVSKEIPNHFAGNTSEMPTRQMKKPSNFETAYRVMDVSRRGITRLQMSFADQMIEPDTSAFDFADFTAANEIAKTGEAAAQAVLTEIQASLDEIRNG